MAQGVTLGARNLRNATELLIRDPFTCLHANVQANTISWSILSGLILILHIWNICTSFVQLTDSRCRKRSAWNQFLRCARSNTAVEASWNVMAHAQKPYFVFRRNGRVHVNRRGASVQSTTGSRGVRISGSNAGYTMFRGRVKSTGYPLHSPVSPSLPLPVHHRVPSHFNWSLLFKL